MTDARAKLIDELRAGLRADIQRLVDGATPRWLSIKGAARHASLSPAAIRRIVAGGKLTPHRPCKGRVLVDRIELDSLIASATFTPRVGRGRAKIRQSA